MSSDGLLTDFEAGGLLLSQLLMMTGFIVQFPWAFWSKVAGSIVAIGVFCHAGYSLYLEERADG